MDRSTFGRVLLRWPKWNKSITDCREELGYQLDGSDNARIAWIENNYPRIRGVMIRELSALELPPNLRDFWEDCLYCDYIGPDGPDLSLITRRYGYFDNAGNIVRGQASVPPLPYSARLLWEEDEDTDSPWVRVEFQIDARWYTKQLLKDATIPIDELMSGFKRTRGFTDHEAAALVPSARVNPPELGVLALQLWDETHDTSIVLRQVFFHPSTQDRIQAAVDLVPQFNKNTEAQLFRRKLVNRILKYVRERRPDVGRPKGKWWMTDSAKG